MAADSKSPVEKTEEPHLAAAGPPSVVTVGTDVSAPIQHADTSLDAPSRLSLAATFLGSVLVETWVPLEAPRVVEDFEVRGLAGQVVESFRFIGAYFWYRLGPNGWHEAWLFTTLRILFFILVPLTGTLVTLAVVEPTASGLANATGGLAQVVKRFASVTGNTEAFLWSVLRCLALLFPIAATVALLITCYRSERIRSLFRLRQSGKPREDDAPTRSQRVGGKKNR